MLAVALTLAVAGGAAARSTFQSTPLQFDTQTPTPFTDVTIITDTPTPFGAAPVVTDTPAVYSGQPAFTETPDPALAGQQAPAAPAPAVPAPAAAVPAQPPAGPGFLPAPTLTNPNDFLPGSGALPRPAPAPLSGPAVSAEDEAAAQTDPAPAVSSAAQLIDSGIRAFSYLWLCCGAVLIFVAVIVFVWLMRRTRR